MCKLIVHAKARAWGFADCFCCHFNAHGFTNCSKSWIQLLSNNVHYHFVYQLQKAAICDCHQNLLENAAVFMFSQQFVGKKLLHQKRFVITFSHLLIYKCFLHLQTTLSVICSSLTIQDREMLARLTSKPCSSMTWIFQLDGELACEGARFEVSYNLTL